MELGFWLPSPAEIVIHSLMLLGTIFWVWMLVDCATNQSLKGNEKVVWVVIVALTNCLGALLYFFIRRPQRSGA